MEGFLVVLLLYRLGKVFQREEITDQTYFDTEPSTFHIGYRSWEGLMPSQSMANLTTSGRIIVASMSPRVSNTVEQDTITGSMTHRHFQRSLLPASQIETVPMIVCPKNLYAIKSASMSLKIRRRYGRSPSGTLGAWNKPNWSLACAIC
ncbi:uncharacterized protein BT62DRAFT_931457 [Guyanagaster necrorhizus]|uniref:Uncharacterized protein n=1 Tax=Guyanagaster necrorhizus TaxID=856835 RepID=A0A9P8AT01_9AGAR|nr:uncharacterized protein BT62DRAFT_931457 [Guyanagaster necrorhizus MCA 3950]KAG7446884.1 hypothetical protein BT62DRAFT_931457 [Guyanagaster necrorhizus MCA 3950]